MICIPNAEKDTSKIQNNYGVLKLETNSNLNKTKQEPLFGVKVEWLQKDLVDPTIIPKTSLEL